MAPRQAATPPPTPSRPSVLPRRAVFCEDRQPIAPMHRPELARYAIVVVSG